MNTPTDKAYAILLSKVAEANEALELHFKEALDVSPRNKKPASPAAMAADARKDVNRMRARGDTAGKSKALKRARKFFTGQKAIRSARRIF